MNCKNCPCEVSFIRRRASIIPNIYHIRREDGKLMRYQRTCDPHKCENPEVKV